MNAIPIIEPINYGRDREGLLSFLCPHDVEFIEKTVHPVQDGDAFLYVARLTEQVVGWAIVFLNYRDEYGFEPQSGTREYLKGRNAYFANFEVREDHRRKGIGSDLLAVVEDVARKANRDRLWLHTGESNTVAQAFYTHHGWIYEKTIQPSWKPVGKLNRVYYKDIHGK